jgi:glycosyltransferase involved in cell wall biosynthesis|tara:strand:- start:593 stop:1492 length:900 start_codon:yes stop_codon:yes gene_type:complete
MNDIKISIGLPVFNEESLISKKIESILSQTHKNFELIISDNGSTDSTSKICENFAQNDPRIKFFRHNENKGIFWNYDFVLKTAINEYFIWTATDDVILPTFLEKTIDVLEKDKTLVGCISKTKPIGKFVETFSYNTNDNFCKKFYKKFRFSAMKNTIDHIQKPYCDRSRYFLKYNSILSIFSVFRTNELKKSNPVKPSGMWEYCWILNILEFGSIHVLDDVLWKFSTGGSSAKGCFNIYLEKHGNFIESVFPYFSFTQWCFKNKGIKFVLSNFDYFSYLLFMNNYLIMAGLLKLIQSKI